MADKLAFLNFINDGSDPATKNTPEETPDSDSETENAERQDFWDNEIPHGNDAEGSPNSSFNSSPELPSQNGFPTPTGRDARQGGRAPNRDGLKNALRYGFRKNVERKVFKGSGAMDRDESGNYDPREEAAAAKRRPPKKKAVPKSGLAEVGPIEYDSDGEEILPSVERGVAAEETAVDPRQGNAAEETVVDPKPAKGSKNKTKTAAGRKKGKGKGKADESVTPIACAKCQLFNLECSILDDPDQFPCTSCAEDGISCILENPKTAKAKDVKKLAIDNAKKQKKEQARLEKERVRLEKGQKRKHGKKLVQLAAQRAAPQIDPKNRKYIACAPCRAGGFHRCSLKTKADTGPCQRCITRKVVCTFEDKVIKTGKAGVKEGKGGKTGKAPAKGRSSLSLGSGMRNRRPSKEKSKKDKEKEKQGMFKKTIKTSFCHPIYFDYHDQMTPFEGLQYSLREDPCYFHTTTAFPMLGLGEILEVEVYGPKRPSPANPFVYEECIPRIVLVKIKGGEYRGEYETENDDESTESEEDEDEEKDKEKYKEEVEDPTYICTPCTFARQRILFCNTHSIRAIAGLKHPLDFDYDLAYDKIMRDQKKGYGANTAGDVKWCSVCVAPAFYECCVPDRYVGGLGCGLMLCEVCAEGLCGKGKLDGLLEEVAEQQAHNSYLPVKERRSVIQQVHLDTLIDRADQDPFRYEDGIRADARFLTTRGELNLWMESMVVSEVEGYEQPETRMDVDAGAGTAGGAVLGGLNGGLGGGLGDFGGRSETIEEYDLRMKLERVGGLNGGLGGGLGDFGGRSETIEEYDLRMKLERGQAEQANPAFMGAAASVSADTDEWAL
ncbi:hypothetical protein V490_04121 [Pseudogymnoascus sp. VKM F-3557]|nr:hypothetical protein V490_04121 [Pseudogymnoascus sp. VKM F-3557]